jgi:hypothetical protein
MDPVANPGQYHYRVATADYAGNESAPATPAAELPESVPTQTRLHQNVPNPFNPSTTIAYDIAAPGGTVVIRVFDVRGKRVRTLVDAVQSPGSKEVVWDGRDDQLRPAASGLYFCQLRVGDVVQTRKMVLVQ